MEAVQSIASDAEEKLMPALQQAKELYTVALEMADPVIDSVQGTVQPLVAQVQPLVTQVQDTVQEVLPVGALRVSGTVLEKLKGKLPRARETSKPYWPGC